MMVYCITVSQSGMKWSQCGVVTHGTVGLCQIGSGNSLLPDGTKQLPEPTLSIGSETALNETRFFCEEISFEIVICKM